MTILWAINCGHSYKEIHLTYHSGSQIPGQSTQSKGCRMCLRKHSHTRIIWLEYREGELPRRRQRRKRKRNKIVKLQTSTTMYVCTQEQGTNISEVLLCKSRWTIKYFLQKCIHSTQRLQIFSDAGVSNDRKGETEERILGRKIFWWFIFESLN